MGAGYAASPHVSFVIPALLLWGKNAYRMLIGGICALLGYLCAYQAPLPIPPLKGTAHIHILKIQPASSPFHKQLAYQGVVYKMETSEKILPMHIPCTLYAPKNYPKPKGDCDYTVTGTIDKKHEKYIFKADKNKPWTPLAHTFSFASWRHKTKCAVRSYLKSCIPDKNSFHLLAALATGTVEDRMLSFTFTQTGLRHLLAISGFHFALIAGLLHLCFKVLFPRKWATCLLLIVIGLYFFFIGNSPSVQRAWIAISLLLLGRLFNLKTPALNALGIALIIEVLIDPRQITTCSFLLSFVATCAILLLYHPFETIMQHLLPKRTTSDILSMKHKWGYAFTCWLRKTLALNLCVHTATIPLVLCIFHAFSPASLIYNLFFPIGIAIAMTLLLIASLTHFLWAPAGIFLHHTNSLLTSKLLLLTTYIPTPLQYTVRTSWFSFDITLITITCLFALSLYVKQKQVV